MRDIMLIFHLVGLTMGLGTGFAHAFLGATADKMPAVDGTKFRLNLHALGLMGNIGIALLLISGFYLITPFWGILMSKPTLIAKLALVVVLIILIALVNINGRKARKGNPEIYFKKLAVLGKLTLLTGLAIVVFAVLTFH